MKLSILSLIILMFVFLVSPQQISAATTFYDTFNVTSGGGDVNYDYDIGDRQSGTAAPILYHWANGPSTVTNGGPNAGTCHMEALGATPPAYLSIGHNFNESGNFSIEYELTRLGTNNANWDAVSFGTDNPWVYPHENPANYGFEVIFFEHGWYHVYMPGQLTGNFYFAELATDSNATLKIRFVVSQSGFPPTGDARIALFINDKPYPIINGDGGTSYSFDYPNGFITNFINWLVLDTDVNMDNVKITTPDSSIDTTAWTSDSDSGISSSKLYTHAVNLADDTNISINGVAFTGSSSNQFGSNWEILTANRAPLSDPLDIYTFGKNPNISANSVLLVSNVFASTSYINAGGLVLTELTPGLPYRLTLFSTAFEVSGGRSSYFVTSDGSAITAVDQDEFGENNGQLLTYDYIASDDGTFSFSTTPITEPWGFYAFANEIIPPPAPGSITASQGTFSDRVAINWLVVDSSDSYTLLRNTTDDQGTAAELTTGLTTNAFDDNSAAVAQNYYYWVKSCNTGGCGSTTGPALGFTSSPNPPDKASNISPTEMEEINAPVTFTASAYSDPGGFTFKASQWQVSELDDFSSIEWSSGDAIPENSFTPPASAISTITNYWRVRYENEFNTWSEWSDGTSFILIPLPEQSVTFADSFNVPGSGDVNNEYNYPCRQTGNFAPLTYKSEGYTRTGGSSAEAGWLTLGQSSGSSPNHGFTESGNFNIKFDVKPDMLGGSADWASIAFGKSDQDSFFPVSSSGLANIFYSHGWMHTYSGENMVGNTFGIPIAEELHVMITVGTLDFENEPASFSTFINNQPVIVDSTTLENLGMPLYGYVRSGGFFNNYVTLYNNGAVSTEPSVFDNLSIYPAPDSVKTYQWTDDADSLVNSSKTYTHKINLNGDDVTINDVTFHGTGFNPGIYNNGDPMITTSTWALTASGPVVAFHDSPPGANLLTGSSHDLANFFAYPHGSFGFHLSGLEPYSSNIFYVYTIGFETGIREGWFSSSYGGAITKVNQDLYDLGGGIIITYDYVASEDGEFSVSITPANLSTGSTACFHVSGFANVKTGEPNPKTVVDCIINFGEVAVGDNKILPMEIENEGGGTVFGTITGDILPFSLDTNVYSATAATSDIINVEFEPDTESVYTNVISLIGNDGTTQVMLTGTGVPEPCLFIIYNLLFIIYYLKERK